MRFNIIIPKGLKKEYNKELQAYRAYMQLNDLPNAWRHLERSHILGQSYPIEHTYTHYLMLRLGFINRDFKEVMGQLLRLMVGGFKSFMDHVPLGNTGGSNVGPLQPMPVKADLDKILKKYR